MSVNLIAYADDLVVLVDNSESLGLLYAVIKEKLATLDFIINQIKTKCCIF